MAQQPSASSFATGPGDTLFDDVTTDVREAAVANTRGAGRFARAAGEAAIEMQLRASRDLISLEHPLHEVDAPPRAIQLVAKQLVGRAGRGAKAAVHTAPQDRLRFETIGAITDEFGEMRFHQMPG